MRHLWTLLTPLLCLALIAPALANPKDQKKPLTYEEQLKGIIQCLEKATKSLQPDSGTGKPQSMSGKNPGDAPDEGLKHFQHQLHHVTQLFSGLLKGDHGSLKTNQQAAKESKGGGGESQPVRKPGAAAGGDPVQWSKELSAYLLKTGKSDADLARLLKQGWKLDDSKLKSKLGDYDKQPKPDTYKHMLAGILIGLLEEAKGLHLPQQTIQPLELALRLIETSAVSTPGGHQVDPVTGSYVSTEPEKGED